MAITSHTTGLSSGNRQDTPAPRGSSRAVAARALLWLQGSYFLLTGIWPLVDVRAFQAVTGRKTDHLVTGLEADHWLVMTVGALITAIALPLVYSAWCKRMTTEIVILALASAIGLTAIDIVYVARRTISPIYLVDAVLEVLLG